MPPDGATFGYMNADSLTVTAQIKAKPDKESQVRQELLSLVAPSRKHVGCLNYDLHQALDNHELFLLHENWITEAHLEQHMQQPDVKAVLARLSPIVAEPPQITLWKKIGC
jgi:quinol monooxygenase YgiN